MCSWCSSSTFTMKWPARWMRGQVLDDFAAQNSTSGGSSDTDVNEFAAMPTGSSPSIAVMTVMPVAKWPSTERNDAASGLRMSGVGAVGCAVLVGHAGWSSAAAVRRRKLERQALGGREHLAGADAGGGVAGAATSSWSIWSSLCAGSWWKSARRWAPGFLRHVHRVVDGAVTPVPLVLELGRRVLRVVDQQVDAVAEVEHVLGHEVVGVGRRRSPALPAGAERSPGRGRRGTRSRRPASRAGSRASGRRGGSSATAPSPWSTSGKSSSPTSWNADVALELLGRDREVRRLHHPGEDLAERAFGLARAVHVERVARPVQRHEERQALHVVPVQMAQQDGAVEVQVLERGVLEQRRDRSCAAPSRGRRRSAPGPRPRPRHRRCSRRSGPAAGRRTVSNRGRRER